MPPINYADGDLAATHGMMTADHTLYGLSDGDAQRAGGRGLSSQAGT